MCSGLAGTIIGDKRSGQTTGSFIDGTGYISEVPTSAFRKRESSLLCCRETEFDLASASRKMCIKRRGCPHLGLQDTRSITSLFLAKSNRVYSEKSLFWRAN